uniref:GST N-terminal domain-containing protein n=1 Tax=Anguilla anguilla TaxID=7936 RepID=A0A0E9SDQ6_ANGAN
MEGQKVGLLFFLFFKSAGIQYSYAAVNLRTEGPKIRPSN